MIAIFKVFFYSLIYKIQFHEMYQFDMFIINLISRKIHYDKCSEFLAKELNWEIALKEFKFSILEKATVFFLGLTSIPVEFKFIIVFNYL